MSVLLNYDFDFNFEYRIYTFRYWFQEIDYKSVQTPYKSVNTIFFNLILFSFFGASTKEVRSYLIFGENNDQYIVLYSKHKQQVYQGGTYLQGIFFLLFLIDQSKKFFTYGKKHMQNCIHSTTWLMSNIVFFNKSHIINFS